MYVLITLPAGLVLEAVVLSKGKRRMRIAVPEFSDSLELRQIDSRWTLDGAPVDFEFIADMYATAYAPSKRSAAGRAGA